MEFQEILKYRRMGKEKIKPHTQGAKDDNQVEVIQKLYFVFFFFTIILL